MGEPIDMADTEGYSCVVFGFDGYYKQMFAGIDNTPGFQYCDKVLVHKIQNNPIFRFFFRLCNSRYCRKILGERGYSKVSEYWFRYEYNRKKTEAFRNLFLFLQYNHLSHDEKFLKYLKSKYPAGKTVFWLTNTLESCSEDLQFIKKNYDYILTFSKKDAEENGLLYHAWCYQEVHTDEQIESDVFFCGWDKGRADLIERVYTRLSSLGIKCDFTILSDEYKRPQVSGIVYTQQYIPYEIIFERMKKTRCLLEIIPGKLDISPTLRWAESIALSKKLLTNNMHMEEAYRNDQQIYIFSEPEDISIEWLKNDNRNQYTKANQISPEYFIEDVSRMCFFE